MKEFCELKTEKEAEKFIGKMKDKRETAQRYKEYFFLTCKQARSAKEALSASWWYIENVSEDTPFREEMYFKLRETIAKFD